MIYEYSSYIKYLGATLESKQATNPAYSLRAMSRDLGVSPSTLSDVLKGKKNFSEQTAYEVGLRLSLSGKKFKYFTTLVQMETTKNEEMKLLFLNQLKVINPKLREHFDVNVDQFRFMSEWYYPAILEMTHLTYIQINPESLAHSLVITPTQAKEALELLVRLELIEPTENNSYKKTKNQFKFQAGSPNQALRKYHHQMLARAQDSLQTQTPNEKLVGSETIPMNIDDLALANDIIEGCFQQILELSKRSQDRTHIYHLGIQFFQVTRDIRKLGLKKEI